MLCVHLNRKRPAAAAPPATPQFTTRVTARQWWLAQRQGGNHSPGFRRRSSWRGSAQGSHSRGRTGTPLPFAEPWITAGCRPLPTTQVKCMIRTAAINGPQRPHAHTGGRATAASHSHHTQGHAHKSPRTLDASQHAANALCNVVYMGYVALVNELVLPAKEQRRGGVRGEPSRTRNEVRNRLQRRPTRTATFFWVMNTVQPLPRTPIVVKPLVFTAFSAYSATGRRPASSGPVTNGAACA